ncbi:MAG: 2-succinyl-5-enolpyruvyl-6-hydroxy-3-cyclohexene-1-carboxylic-acid synthase [Chloroflexota bacterium]
MAANNIQYATHAYVSAFVDELARSGVHHVCVCPGSRSTPLAMILAETPALKVWMHLDERSAAFFALGIAKMSYEPVALVCTSGTAAANFLPAVVEAHFARIPLIVLTADRPPELRDIGAPQTIDQVRLYGSHVKWFVDMALPENTPDALRYVRTVANRAVAEAVAATTGPVHLNFPFREPLVPLPPESSVADMARPDHRPFATVKRGLRRTDLREVKALASDLARVERGLIVCGPHSNPDFAPAVARLSEMIGYPILADPLSQLRCGQHDCSNVISTYDAFLRDPAFVERAAPQIILRLGATPTSKPLLQYLKKYANVRQILIGSEWYDPDLIVSDVFKAESRLLCEDLVDQLGGHSREAGSPWLWEWTETERHVRTAIDTHLLTNTELFEGSVFPELSKLMPNGTTLYTSSSMPVRDLDTFFPVSEYAIRFLANRGANGIDGVVSSALGASAVCNGPLVLVIGDIAFYHDMNGLMAAKLHHLNATIILINNDGGGIFSFLPQAAYPEHFEQLYGTPHGLDFRHTAELYGAHYTLATDWHEFRNAVSKGVAATGLKIIEIQTNRAQNVKQHRAIWQVVSTVLAGLAPASVDGVSNEATV